MALSKDQKKKILEDLRDKISQSKAVLLVGITKLKVKDMNELKKRLKGMNSNIKVVKKTLAEIVFKENKLDFDKKNFKEEIALVFGFKDEVSPAKIAHQFSKENENLKILGGFIEKKFEGIEMITALALLPTREELLGRLVGTISAPASNLVYVLQGNIKGLIQALGSIKK
jgi:large subunit ribosomal protein L10